MKITKGNSQFYLNRQGDVYHFVKRVKVYSKEITKGKTKTATKTVCDFCFTIKTFEDVYPDIVDLNDKDIPLIVNMIMELERCADD